jgi:glycosyltransferase involved in cell wall biosynthesis
MKKTLIGYVPESFPQVSETFVINEIWGMLQKDYAVAVIPRINMAANIALHERYDAIRDNINLLNISGGAFSIRAFLDGIFYGSPVRPRLRINGIINHIKNAINISRHYAGLEKARPDILITHFCYDNAIASALYSSKYNVKHILWMHGSDIYTVPHRSLHWISRNSNAVVTNSAYSQRLIKELGVTKPVHVSNLGIDLSKFKIPDFESKSNTPLIICVARLGHNKDHNFLLRVFSRIKTAIPDSELWLVGDGPNLDQLEQYAKDHKIESVIFYGSQSQEQVAHFLSQAWVFSLFSDKEGLGVVLLEAQASGLPCVCNSVGGMPEVVSHGETGFVIEKSSFDAERVAADSFIQLLQNHDLRKNMGIKARARAELYFSEARHHEVMDLLIKQILNS